MVTHYMKNEEIVLSISAGKTQDIINQFQVHSHPDTRNYRYRKTNYITFRQSGGGAMNTVYTISKLILLHMNDWENQLVHTSNLKEIEKTRIKGYIVNRYPGMGFEKDLVYKFYLLDMYCPLPNKPHPLKNNAGGWIYSLEDLLQGGVVETINK